MIIDNLEKKTERVLKKKIEGQRSRGLNYRIAKVENLK